MTDVASKHVFPIYYYVIPESPENTYVYVAVFDSNAEYTDLEKQNTKEDNLLIILKDLNVVHSLSYILIKLNHTMMDFWVLLIITPMVKIYYFCS